MPETFRFTRTILRSLESLVSKPLPPLFCTENTTDRKLEFSGIDGSGLRAVLDLPEQDSTALRQLLCFGGTLPSTLAEELEESDKMVAGLNAQIVSLTQQVSNLRRSLELSSSSEDARRQRDSQKIAELENALESLQSRPYAEVKQAFAIPSHLDSPPRLGIVTENGEIFTTEIGGEWERVNPPIEPDEPF